MRLFQITDGQVTIVKDGQFYSDTVDNYLLDGGTVTRDGQPLTLAVHDSQQEYCEVNGAVKNYPEEFFEKIIDNIDALLAKKAEREYVEPTLDAVKATKIAELKAARDAAEIEPIEYNDDRFDYDEQARDRLAIARQAIEDGAVGGIVWTTADNTRVTLVLDDFKGIGIAAALRSNALHVKYNELKSWVQAAETAEDVAAVVW